MKSHKTSDEITKVGKKKQKNAELENKIKAVEINPKSVMDSVGWANRK